MGEPESVNTITRRVRIDIEAEITFVPDEAFQDKDFEAAILTENIVEKFLCVPDLVDFGIDVMDVFAAGGGEA